MPTTSGRMPTRLPTGSRAIWWGTELQPGGLASRSHSQYVEGKSLVDIIKEDLVAERIAIESYGEIVRFPTSPR